MIEAEENKEYLPIQGLDAFNKATADLLLGQDHPATKVSLQLKLNHIFSCFLYRPAGLTCDCRGCSGTCADHRQVSQGCNMLSCWEPVL